MFCKVGDTLGYIRKSGDMYKLFESKVNSVRILKNGDVKVYTKMLEPLYDSEIKANTEIMSGKSLILITEPFVIDDAIRARATRWVNGVNKDPSKVKGIF